MILMIMMAMLKMTMVIMMLTMLMLKMRTVWWWLWSVINVITKLKDCTSIKTAHQLIKSCKFKRSRTLVTVWRGLVQSLMSRTRAQWFPTLPWAHAPRLFPAMVHHVEINDAVWAVERRVSNPQGASFACHKSLTRAYLFSIMWSGLSSRFGCRSTEQAGVNCL